jgi:cytochrome P450
MHEPSNAIEAVTHPDPSAFYRRLRQGPPLAWDGALGLWVASSAAAVLAGLAHPGLRVRPVLEPVPAALRGTAAGEVFALLVRMNDGAFHAAHKPQATTAATAISLRQVAELAAGMAPGLQERMGPNELLSLLPVRVMAALLGVPEPLLDGIARQVQAFTRGLAASASTEAIDAASEAAAPLMAYWQQQGHGPVQAAQRIGFMQQSLDATAGLLGNTLVLLRRQPELAAPLLRSHEAACALVAEVARWDAPVQNTRRFAAAALTLLDQPIAPGQGVLLVLASANRDAALNEHPDAFDVQRSRRQSLTFGGGAHACPGECVAIEIVAASLLSMGARARFDAYFRPLGTYVPLPNARIPLFAN